MSGDISAREERIRARAHRLWQQAGEPEGRDEEFWRLAEIIEDDEPKAEGDPDPQAQSPLHTRRGE